MHNFYKKICTILIFFSFTELKPMGSLIILGVGLFYGIIYHIKSASEEDTKRRFCELERESLASFDNTKNDFDEYREIKKYISENPDNDHSKYEFRSKSHILRKAENGMKENLKCLNEMLAYESRYKKRYR